MCDLEEPGRGRHREGARVARHAPRTDQPRPAHDQKRGGPGPTGRHRTQTTDPGEPSQPPGGRPTESEPPGGTKVHDGDRCVPPRRRTGGPPNPAPLATPGPASTAQLRQDPHPMRRGRRADHRNNRERRKVSRDRPLQSPLPAEPPDRSKLQTHITWRH